MGNLQKDKQIEIPPPPHSNPSHETNERTKSKDTKEITKLPQPKSSSNPSLPSTRNRSSSSTLDSIPKFFSDPSDTQTQKPIKTGIFRHLNRTNSLDSTDSKSSLIASRKKHHTEYIKIQKKQTNTLSQFQKKLPFPLQRFLKRFTSQSLLIFSSILLIVIGLTIITFNRIHILRKSQQIPLKNESSINTSTEIKSTLKNISLSPNTQIQTNLTLTGNYSSSSQDSLEDAEQRALLNPDSAEDQHKAGLLALSLGQTDKARHYFKAALAAKPTALGSLSNLAHLEFRTANYSEAIKHYSRLLSFAPTNPFITYRIYLCEILSGNLHPPDPNAFPPGAIQTYFALAAYHSQTGNSTQSKQLFAEARARFPNLTSSYERDFALIQKSSNPQSRINTESIEIELSTKDSAFQNPFPPSPENSPYSTNQPIQ